MKFTNTSYKYDGRVQDEIWTSYGRRGIARRRIRPAKPSARFEYSPLFSLAAARATWVLLSTPVQAEWNALAGSTFGWPLQGSPREMDGETFFANYYTVLLTLDPAASVPDAPASGPTWQTKPKFFEFAEWIDGGYTLKAETDFDMDTVLLFSGLPPSKAGFKPDFAREVFIGNHTFDFGLFENEEFDGVSAMMAATFGSIDATQKIWGRVWEVQGGYIRTLKDPCTPDPTDAPPTGDLTVKLYNAYDSEISFGYVDLYQADYELLGESSFESLAFEAETTYDIELNEGKTLDDIEWVAFQVYWNDGSSFFSNEDYSQENPFEFSLEPGF